MLITLEPGANRHNVLKTLREVIVNAQNLASSQGGGRELRIDYLTWVNATRARLRGQISSADLDRLVTTPRYITVLSMQIPEPVMKAQPNPFGGGAHVQISGPNTAPIREMISLEIAEHIDHLTQALTTLTGWTYLLDQRPGALVIADSNVYCHHPDRLDEWNVGADARVLPSQDVHMILPLAVLDELDRQKDRGQGAAATNARETIKLLDGLLPNGVIRPRGNAPENPAFPRGAISIDLWPDPPGHVRLPRTDDEVIARAVAFQALAGRKVKLLTGDIGMSTRARMVGLEAIRLDLPDATHKPKRPPRGTQHPALKNTSGDGQSVGSAAAAGGDGTG
ncbi:PIN domain-containing protein [Microbispora rosea]|uniref:PIN domain-containing protein n=1 Tax=Microbispora rosea TaxID=58117 RepID=A0A1N7GI73_9ACTN|nr:PIN domain-containing protein [Microbispora rosea]SIS12295.1 PIN domain-containing protein [Microbispora rosea]